MGRMYDRGGGQSKNVATRNQGSSGIPVQRSFIETFFPEHKSKCVSNVVLYLGTA